MESIPASRKRIRNRKRKRHGKSKRLDRDRLKVEVRSANRQKHFAGCSVYVAKDKLVGKTMEATAFWENYTTAQQWQQTHNVIWWRTRCQALEQENQILRDTVRHLARTRQCHCQRKDQVRNEIQSEHHRCQSEFQNDTRNEFQNEATNQFQNETQNQFQNETQIQFQNRALNVFHTETQSNFKEAEVEDEPVSDDESLEFQLNDGMIDFMKQSMQHKLELKQKREEEASEKVEEEDEDEVFFQGGAAWMQKRTENAKLLYGEASPRILAMETALQTTIDRHKDKARPQYWPNIPLKL